MRFVPFALCLALTASFVHCKSREQGPQEEYDKNQTVTLQKMLNASIDDGGAPDAAEPKPGASGRR